MRTDQADPGPSSGTQATPFTVAAPAVELPKGGGAIRGIGEKFAANPVTGTGAMTVPIAAQPWAGWVRPGPVAVVRLGRRKRPLRLRLVPRPACR